MKVILLSDVASLGKRGAVVNVADGYANNFLFPRKLATSASGGALKVLEEQNRAKARRQEEEVSGAKEIAEQLEQTVLTVTAKAGGNGRLFGTITNIQVAEAIQSQLHVAIDRHKIELKDGIKALGTYPVSVRLGNAIIAKTQVQVVSQS
jgi:large subunit ribosomal protein L9